MPSSDLNEQHKQHLLKVARESIEYGLQHSCPPKITMESCADPLKAAGCCFVTLTIDGQLRGCIGALEPYQALIKDVSEHAYAAAFRDPRFPKLEADELDRIHIAISVLTPVSPIDCQSESDLLAQLKPGEDGLILEEKDREGFVIHKATFLPSVWEQLPKPEDFLQALKQKAGLGRHDWSDDLHFYRYASISFKETLPFT